MVTENVFDDPFSDVMEEPTTAVIHIKPQGDQAVIAFTQEITKLRDYALARVIACDEDIKPITDDLAIISKLKKALKEKQEEYCKPVKAHLDDINAVFKDILTVLDEADGTNRMKVAAYRSEQIRKQAEAEEINRKKLELARQEAAFNGTGEVTIDTTPVEAAPVIARVSTNMGTVSTAKVWKWEPVDTKLIPPEYLIIDAAKITKVVKAGLRNIPGIRIYCEDSIRVNTK